LVESSKYAVSAKFDESVKMPGDDSKNLLYQQKIDIFGLNMATEPIVVCK